MAKINDKEIVDHLIAGGKVSRKVKKNKLFIGDFVHDQYERDGWYIKLVNLNDDTLTSFKLNRKKDDYETQGWMANFEEMNWDDWYCVTDEIAFKEELHE